MKSIRRRAMKRFFCLISLLVFPLITSSEEITNHSFLGKWCGKWDEIYLTCLTIDSINSESTAKYQWREYEHGKFKSSKKPVERINRNTLKIDNIWFVLNEKNMQQAKAIGIFRVQTRMANLVKEIPAT